MTKSLKNIANSYPYLLLTLGLLIASLPGLFLTKFTINEFDEPYQILNAYDWRNAPYSPLSSYLSHFIGEAFHWKWLIFRQLAFIFNVAAIYIASIYAVKHSERKHYVILTAIACTFFCMSLKGTNVFFGWDSWTVFTTTLALICLLSYFRKTSVNKIIILSIISALAILMRLPNICIIPIAAVLIFMRNIEDRQISFMWKASLIYIIFTLFVTWIIIILLFGSLQTYINIFESNEITHHTPSILIKAYFGRMAYCLLLAFIVGLINYGLVKCSFSSLKLSSKIIISGLIIISFEILLFIMNTQMKSNTPPVFLSAIELFLIYIIIKSSWPNFLSSKNINAFSIFCIASICAIGSNIGFYKYMVWSTLPLVVMESENYFTKSFKLLYSSAMLSLFIYYLYAIPFVAAFDDGTSKTTHRFNGGVLDGMYTSPVKGEYIDDIRRNVKNFEDRGFDVTVVRTGNNYIWEYIFLKRNEFFRHKFNYWEMLNDPNYAQNLIKKMRTSENPPLLLYMDCDYEEPTTVQAILEKEMIRVADGGCFCFYAFRKDIEKYYPDCHLPEVQTDWNNK